MVWNYFGLESNENDVPIKEKEDKTVCRACNKTVLAKGGNISNMLTHLHDHHPELYAEAQPMCSQSGYQQPTITEAFDKGKKYDARSPRALELNKCVAYYLAKDMYFYTPLRSLVLDTWLQNWTPSITFHPGSTSVSRRFPAYLHKSGLMS